MQAYLQALDKKKPVIWTGDLNVAHEEIDIARPDTNHKSAGFTDEERGDFGKLLNEGDFVDVWRHHNPSVQDFTYYGYRFNCKAKNIGWRLDYFVASRRLVRTAKTNVVDYFIFLHWLDVVFFTDSYYI